MEYIITFKLDNMTVITKEIGTKHAFYQMLSILIIPAFNNHILWIIGCKKNQNNEDVIYEYDRITGICELYDDN